MLTLEETTVTRRTLRGRRPSPVGRMRQDAGAVAILVALSMSTFLVAFAALAVDFGQVYTRKGQLQSVADLTALSAARELPDTNRARQVAVETLCADANLVQGWDRTQVCPAGDLDPAWLADGDPVNGEVSFFREDADGNGRYDSSEQNTPAAAEAVAIRVLLPSTTVTFGLAKTFGADHVTVQEAATARIGTPLGMGMVPFAVTTADLTPEREFRFCIRDPGAVDGPAPTGACSRPEAERGYLEVDRAGVADPAATLVENIQQGVQPTVQRWPIDQADLGLLQGSVGGGPGGTLNGLQCGVLDPIAVPLGIEPLVTNVPGEAVNCVEVHTRGFAQQLTGGLLDQAAGDKGRLVRRCSDEEHFEQGSFELDGTDLLKSPSPLVRGIAPEELAGRIREGAAPVPGLISGRAFQCPRLVAMPVIDVDTVDDAGTYPVVDITYAWIEDDGEGLVWQDTDTLQSVSGYVVDPGYFPDTVSGSPVVGRYLGDYLPKEAVLVRDLGDT